MIYQPTQQITGLSRMVNDEPVEEVEVDRYSTPEIALDALEALYEELYEEIKIYAMREKASPYFIAKRNDQLQRLYKISVTLAQLVNPNYAYGERIWKNVSLLRAEDPSLDAILMNLNFTSNPNRIGYSNINCYAN